MRTIIAISHGYVKFHLKSYRREERIFSFYGLFPVPAFMCKPASLIRTLFSRLTRAECIEDNTAYDKNVKRLLCLNVASNQPLKT